MPLEERRFKEMTEQQFGEKGGPQAKICGNIMADTGEGPTGAALVTLSRTASGQLGGQGWLSWDIDSLADGGPYA